MFIALWFLNIETVKKIEKNCNTFIRQRISNIFKKLLASLGRKLTLKSLNKFYPKMSMFMLSRWHCHGNVLFGIFALVQCGTILFAVETGTTISCSFCRQYTSVLSIVSSPQVKHCVHTNNFIQWSLIWKSSEYLHEMETGKSRVGNKRKRGRERQRESIRGVRVGA